LQPSTPVLFRIGTGEITDSLALEISSDLLMKWFLFRATANVLLELKTRAVRRRAVSLDPKEP
jgi:hypothetical protein